ncbi:MAG: DUF6980 family protein [Gammaproteobacteria bacterium]
MKHCCEEMELHLTQDELHIQYIPKFREYGISCKHDGVTGFQLIEYCPWCGKSLPESLRDKWFSELEALGFEPEDPRLPKKYLFDEWWAKNE